VSSFRVLFPHVGASDGVLRAWVQDFVAPRAAIPVVKAFKYLRKNRAPRIRSFEDLAFRSCCAERIFEEAPCISQRDFATALQRCNVEVTAKQPFVLDYLALRSAGVDVHGDSEFELHRKVPQEHEASVVADRWLHAEGVADSQRRLATMDGVAVSYKAIQHFVSRGGAPRVVTVEEVELDDELRGDLELLLAEHLVARGVHRVCEELLARRRVCLPFAELRSHLLAEKSRPLGRLEVEDCWRVCFAWHERTRECRAHPAALDAVRLSLAPTLDAFASVKDTSTQRAFRTYKQAAICAFDPAFDHGDRPLWKMPKVDCACCFCARWDLPLCGEQESTKDKRKRFIQASGRDWLPPTVAEQRSAFVRELMSEHDIVIVWDIFWRAPKAVRSDKETALAAVGLNQRCFSLVSPSLRADKEFVLAAARVQRNLFRWASDELRRYGLAFVRPTLLGDAEFVLAAMRLDPFAFRWASKPLRADKAFVLEALGLTSRPFELKRFVSHSLREDEDVLAIFGRNARDSIAAVPTGSSVEPVPVVSEEVASEDGEELESLDGALSELEALDATASEPGPASRSLAAEASSPAAGAELRSKRLRVS